jgi:glycosyltransferase involved in cell wall biosynthesis
VLDGETGRLCEPDAGMIAAALLQIADAPAWRSKLSRQAVAAARARTWEAALGELAAGYDALTETAVAEQPEAPVLRVA